MNKNKFFVFELIAVLFLVSLDLITKQMAVKYLSSGSIDIIPKVFSLTLLEGGNSGAAFGLFQGGFWMFTIITVIVIAVIVFVLKKMVFQKRYLPVHFTLVLMLSGALGNFADRTITMIKYGHSYVIDFLYFELINFPIFNIADCYVTISAIGMLLFVVFYYKDEDFDIMLGRVKNEIK